MTVRLQHRSATKMPWPQRQEAQPLLKKCRTCRVNEDVSRCSSCCMRCRAACSVLQAARCRSSFRLNAYRLNNNPVFDCVTRAQEQQTSFAAAGLFKFAMWPYGIKLLWSPIVDSLYFSKCGRRKTWIVPLQLIVAAVLWHISHNLQGWLLSYDVTTLAVWFGIIVLLSATQDIAVDGWALVILSRRNTAHAASAQTIGLTAGYFASYTLLLAFSSEAFGSVISVPTYMRCLAVCFVVQPSHPLCVQL